MAGGVTGFCLRARSVSVLRITTHDSWREGRFVLIVKISRQDMAYSAKVKINTVGDPLFSFSMKADGRPETAPTYCLPSRS